MVLFAQFSAKMSALILPCVNPTLGTPLNVNRSLCSKLLIRVLQTRKGKFAHSGLMENRPGYFPPDLPTFKNIVSLLAEFFFVKIR
jgi:hypothetical protein